MKTNKRLQALTEYHSARLNFPLQRKRFKNFILSFSMIVFSAVLSMTVKAQIITGLKIDCSPPGCTGACDCYEDDIQPRYTVTLGQGFDAALNYFYIWPIIFRSAHAGGTTFYPNGEADRNDAPIFQVRQGVLTDGGGTPNNVFYGGAVSRISNEHATDLWTWIGDGNLHDTTSGRVVGYFSDVSARGEIDAACASSYSGQTKILDISFTINYGDNTNTDDKSDDHLCETSGCSSCQTPGMPVWSVSEPYISLFLKDEPLGYQPVKGQRISLALDFKQTEQTSGTDTNIFSVGKKWNFAWFSFATLDTNGIPVVHFPEGKERKFFAAQDYLTNTRITGDITNGFTLSYPDGSKDIYGLIVTNSSGVFRKAFLTQRWNPQSQKTLFYYSGYAAGTSAVVRLQYVVDGDGRTNSISYVSSNSYSTNLISQVTDPFGRGVSMAYDNTGHLTNITDVAGLSSSVNYGTNDLATSLTTPYGTTSFAITGTAAGQIAPNGRSVLVTSPDGSHQLFLYTNAAPVPDSYDASQIPGTTPFTNTFDADQLNYRDSYYWGPRQYAALSTTNISGFTTNDFLKARMKHWLKTYGNTVGRTVSLERQPSPDGTSEGQKTWYDYFGKIDTRSEGAQVEPLFVAQVLPDGTSRFTRSMRNSFGKVTNEVSTYSIP